MPNTQTIPFRKSGVSQTRTAQTVKRLAMYREKATHDAKGKVIKQRYHSSTPESDGKIVGNRKYFANTRIASQSDLERMREAVAKARDPNTFLLRDKRLPTSLITEQEECQVKIEQVEPFGLTFGPKSQRRKAKIAFQADEIVKEATKLQNEYNIDNDINIQQAIDKKTAFDPRMIRGQTHRVYSEIYKVIDSSDVLVYVLDARDPENTLSKSIEKYLLQAENQHRHLIYVLNKVDLVPTWATKSWILKLQKQHPTIAFCATAKKAFGKAEIISVFRQFSLLHKERPNISIGFLGFPNVGKSSVINAIIGKQVCNVAPIPGETKVWQYVNLTKKIFLIDAPGVVFPDKTADENADDLRILLQGVIRTEYVEYPEKLVPSILKKVQKLHVLKTYQIRNYEDEEDLLEQLAYKWGRILKGGDADKRSVARKLFEDFVRGKLPHFVAAYQKGEIDAFKRSLEEQKNKWNRASDSELILFKNQQKLKAAGQAFEYEENDEMKQFADDKLDRIEEKGAEKSDSEDSLQEFESDDLDGAFEPEAFEMPKKRVKASEVDVDVNVQHKKAKMAYKTGIQRATRINKTRKRDLLRAAASGVVDEKDLNLVIKEKKLRSRKDRQGGAKGGKTGDQFYAEAKAKKEILKKITGKRM
ncbi:Nucleolar GTP-binding protein 2 [Spironucleus salmonicida]|uniref:Nucleolar GTP-binding protein 2 n=1 Tax=Spironucleus salmonicida TaxID=348837 RepID=V6M616_9EUKA|nr:Nucleolar GTP-binding protein 2 [Spironucleus salmonicida]|eukprot:EST48809.1 Nucleolar GTP-binding protein 2 [Spironucleus salmonicida]